MSPPPIRLATEDIPSDTLFFHNVPCWSIKSAPLPKYIRIHPLLFIFPTITLTQATMTPVLLHQLPTCSTFLSPHPHPVHWPDTNQRDFQKTQVRLCYNHPPTPRCLKSIHQYLMHLEKKISQLQSEDKGLSVIWSDQPCSESWACAHYTPASLFLSPSNTLHLLWNAPGKAGFFSSAPTFPLLESAPHCPQSPSHTHIALLILSAIYIYVDLI